MLIAKAKSYLRYYIGISALFALAYLPANRLAEFRSHVAVIAVPWETDIPFVPWMIFPYLSILILFWMPLFFLDRQEIRQLAINMAWVTVACGLVFITVPTTVAFERPEGSDGLLALFRTFYLFDKPYNAFPSLHIAYSYLCTLTCVSHSSSLKRLFLIPWFMVIVLSVLLTHQHHVPDILAAIVLAHLTFLLAKR